ncbi:MAG: ADP-ribosylglycohydrolase family protein [Firmicutes bacterium]|nr:ADP-ribosylglycohydrolase family protein [Bacillota bacterium]
MKRFTEDNFTGCLLGGAIGDALGYPVQFKNIDEIRVAYGYSGIRDFSELSGARISVNTQMTLFTANGLIYTDAARRRGEYTDVLENLYASYIDWMRTQSVKSIPAVKPVCWLLNVPELRVSRTPEQTCFDALSCGRLGTIEDPINDNKSCGGITRSAPIGLYSSDQYETVKLAAQAAAITHGNPMGYIPAAAFAYIISNIVYSDKDLADIIADAVKMLKSQFYSHYKDVVRITELLTLAVQLINFDRKTDAEERMRRDSINIKRLGRGRAAEETLAIAVYCCLKYEDDFELAMAAAVNHSGDSDTTGSLVGNILGALKGASGLPKKFIEGLELKNIICEISADLYEACSGYYDCEEKGSEWNDKYGTYRL